MKKILCFGDSNTWGYNPENGERFGEGIRWTSILQKKLAGKSELVEEGLCGRTSIFEDQYRPDRKGINSLEPIFNQTNNIDSVILMLGTNDCKSFFGASASKIAKGVEACLDIVLQHVPSENIILVSPIHLGKDVWRENYDPEFSKASVETSYDLKEAYKKVANKKHVNFLAASDYVKPSSTDQEHLDVYSHAILADVLYNKIQLLNNKVKIA